MPQNHKLGGGELFYAHGAVGVQLGGGNANFRAQTQLAAIVKAAGGVDRHHGGVRLTQEAAGVVQVAGADDFRMVGTVAGNVVQRRVQIFHYAHGQN